MSVRILLKQKIICSQFLVGDSWFGLHPHQLSPQRIFELIICFFNESILLTDQMFFSQESKQVCHYEMEGPGLPPLHNTGSLSASSVAGSSSGQMPESPSVGAPHMHPHLTSGKNLTHWNGHLQKACWIFLISGKALSGGLASFTLMLKVQFSTMGLQRIGSNQQGSQTRLTPVA